MACARRTNPTCSNLDAAAAEVGLEGLTPHELRHTCASLAVARGANVKALQRMLGHASAKETLDTYTDLFEDDLDGVATALDEVLAPTLVGKVWAKHATVADAEAPDMKKTPH
ncbi:MAG: hypothetical protein QOE37_1384 [Microbacteriaceae bacterium]|nr:hypothetical protein [Microbacteriaceae bacterium]